MAEFKILCPACTSILSSKKPIPNGKKITCPHCHKPFVAATADAGSSSDSSSLEFKTSSLVSAGSAPKHEPPRSAEKPHQRPANVPVKRGARRALLTVMLMGLIVLAGVGGGLGVYFYMKPPEPEVAQTPKSKIGHEGKADPKVAAATQKKKSGPDTVRKDDKAGKGPEKPAPKSDLPANDLKPGEQPKAAIAAAPQAIKRPKVAEWQEFKSAKGGYTIQFPGKPEEHLTRDADVIHYEAEIDLDGTEYHVSFYRLKKDELAMPAKSRLDAIAAQFKDQTQEKSERELNGQPVLQLQMLLGDKKILAFHRWLVYKEHVFQIAVSGDKEKIGPDQVTRFLDSFHLVADPQGEFVDLAKGSNIPEEKKKK